MDQVKVKNVIAANAAQDPLSVNVHNPALQDGELSELAEWETALASGGEAVVCW